MRARLCPPSTLKIPTTTILPSACTAVPYTAPSTTGLKESAVVGFTTVSTATELVTAPQALVTSTQ